MAGSPDPALYKELLVVLGTAGVVIPLFRKIRINSTLGFLMAGVLLGPGVLGQVAEHQPWLKVILFAPEAPCYGELTMMSGLEWEPVGTLDSDPQQALADYSANQANFKKVMDQLAKTVAISSVWPSGSWK